MLGPGGVVGHGYGSDIGCPILNAGDSDTLTSRWRSKRWGLKPVPLIMRCSQSRKYLIVRGAARPRCARSDYVTRSASRSVCGSAKTRRRGLMVCADYVRRINQAPPHILIPVDFAAIKQGFLLATSGMDAERLTGSVDSCKHNF
jgi:hypothetical protein